MRPINIYLAGSIFYEKDVLYNKMLAEKIRAKAEELEIPIDLYSPVENKTINDKTKFADSRMIYAGDYERLEKTDLLVCCIDGDTPPIGTTCEIGIFSEMAKQSTNKSVIALFTDSRDGFKTVIPEKIEIMKEGIAESQFSYTNLFLVGTIHACGTLVNNVDDFIKEIGLRLIKIYDSMSHVEDFLDDLVQVKEPSHE